MLLIDVLTPQRYARLAVVSPGNPRGSPDDTRLAVSRCSVAGRPRPPLLPTPMRNPDTRLDDMEASGLPAPPFRQVFSEGDPDNQESTRDPSPLPHDGSRLTFDKQGERVCATTELGGLTWRSFW